MTEYACVCVRVFFHQACIAARGVPFRESDESLREESVGHLHHALFLVHDSVELATPDAVHCPSRDVDGYHRERESRFLVLRNLPNLR